MKHTPRLSELVAGLAPVQDTELQGSVDSAHARELLDRILASPETTRRRTLLVPAAAVVVLVAIGVGILVGSRRTPTASAATVLKRAASVARTQRPLVAAPGEFVYTKSAWFSLATYVDKSTSYSALIPWARESWVGPTGGRMHQVPGQARFLSGRDRNAWIAAGRQPFTGPAASSPEELPAARPLDLPTDPDLLFERLQRETASHGDRQYAEMFVLIGDSLRETNASPEQRAALYAVAARIPSVDLVGSVTDSAGRPGIAVAKDDGVNHLRSTLIFDPKTSLLLAEEEFTLPGNSFGYPAGTRIESATYLETTIVGSLGARR